MRTVSQRLRVDALPVVLMAAQIAYWALWLWDFLRYGRH